MDIEKEKLILAKAMHMVDKENNFEKNKDIHFNKNCPLKDEKFRKKYTDDCAKKYGYRPIVSPPFDFCKNCDWIYTEFENLGIVEKNEYIEKAKRILEFQILTEGEIYNEKI